MPRLSKYLALQVLLACNIAFVTGTAKVYLETCLPVKGVENTDFGLAMHGYDPFKADALAPEGNAGIMNGEIFDYECSFGKGYRNFMSFRSDLNCESSMKTEAFRSVQAYSKAVSGSSSNSLDVSVDLEGSAFGFDAKASAKYASARQGSQSDAVQALMSGKGEVYVTTATCFTHDVSLDAFSRVKFSQNFVDALMELNNTAGLSTNEETAVFARFLNDFGTHFIQKAELGASLTYQKVFETAATSKASQMTRSECMSESAGGCVSASYNGVVGGASAKACVNKAMNKCQAGKGSSQSEIEDSTGSFSIVSRGSRPKDLDSWLDSKFEPIPIGITSKPLYDLLTARNLEKNADYGFEDGLDPNHMRTVFRKMYKKYCTVSLDMTQADCTKKMSGCGMIGDCLYSQNCVDDATKPKGFRCVDKTGAKDKYCKGEEVTGDIQPSTKYTGQTFKQCLKKCVDAGGKYLTIKKNKDPDNFGTDECWCVTGDATYIDTTKVQYKTMPVGKCISCHGTFLKGDPNAQQKQRFGKGTVKDCAAYCSRKGATYATILDNNSPIDKYNGDCWCEFGAVTVVDTLSSLGFRTGPILTDCDKMQYN